MKDLIKKQEEELEDNQLLLLEHLILGNATELYKGGEQAGVVIEEMKKFIKKEIISKVRKETAKYVCNKMMGKNIKLDDEVNIKEKILLKETFGTDETPEHLRERRYGYNQRIKEEKEIKQSILKEFNIGGKQNESRTQRSADLPE